MKILITGALGHIGSKFIHSIESEEFEEVRLIDNFLCQRYVSLFNLPHEVNFSFIEEDICVADLDQHFSDIDVVIHLAAITDATNSHEQKDEVERVNYLGTKKVAEACIRNNCKLIFPSTTSVYGVQEGLVDETCSIDDLKPQSPYAETKLRSEQLLESLSNNNGLKYIVFRFGTIFGTSIGMRFHTAVNKFCWQSVMGTPLTVWETALNQKRPYLGVSDAINALNFIIREDLFDCQIYNVVSSNNTVQDIIDEIKKSKPDVQIKLTKASIMNQLSYEVSSKKIHQLGFASNNLIEHGIKETISLIKSGNKQNI